VVRVGRVRDRKERTRRRPEVPNTFRFGLGLLFEKEKGFVWVWGHWIRPRRRRRRGVRKGFCFALDRSSWSTERVLCTVVESRSGEAFGFFLYFI